MPLLAAAAAAFSLAQLAAAFAPGLGVFLVALVAMGVANLAFQAMANACVQTWVDPEVRAGSWASMCSSSQAAARSAGR